VADSAKTSGAKTPDSSVPDLSALSYEQARDELVRVVGELEQGSATLEESLALWERGEALARRCEEWLLGAKERLDAARAASAGSTTGRTASDS
jgi:exodeoxyribonuclease VII small subunit